MITTFWKTCVAGLVVLVPAWATFLILSTLFTTLDGLVGRYMYYTVPGLGLLLLVLLIILAGISLEHVVAQGILATFSIFGLGLAEVKWWPFHFRVMGVGH